MALSSARVGHSYAPYTYEVSLEKVQEYADATFLDDERYGSPNGPTGEPPVAPPTFAACVTGRVIPMVVDDPELGAHWNLLHTAQSFEFSRSLRVHQILECAPRIADITTRRNLELLTITVDATDADDGQPVFHSSSTLVFLEG